MANFMTETQRVEHLLSCAIKDINLLEKQLELYRHALRESNDWLSAGEGVDLCYYIDDEPDKKIVRQLLDNIYNEPKKVV